VHRFDIATMAENIALQHAPPEPPAAPLCEPEAAPAAAALAPDTPAAVPEPPSTDDAAASSAPPLEDTMSPAKREREQNRFLCAFCHEGEDSDDPDEDPLVAVDAGTEKHPKPAVAHDQCLWWCPDLVQAEDLTWMNVGSALRRCARLKCAVCGEGHAPLGCKRKACKKNWHYPCAMEPTTGLVVYEDEFCVACPICHEVMIRRERKKQMLADEKKRAKDAAKAAAKAAAAAKKSAAAAATAASSSSSSSAPPIKAAAKGGKQPAVPKPATSKAGKKLAAPLHNPFAAPAPPPAPSAPPPPPPPPRAPSPPPIDPRFAKAEEAIAALFSSQRSEDLPLEMVRTAAGLADDELDQLLERMDAENKVMCRAGSVYLI
jgi:hypothetical protein